MTTPERPPHDFMAAVSEQTVTRCGNLVTLATHHSGRGFNIASFSRHTSPSMVRVLATDEELMIARSVCHVLGLSRKTEDMEP